MTVSIMTPHASVRLVAVRVGSLAARALVAVAFVVAGAANASSTPSVIEIFDAVGVGQWLRYLAAVVEVGGAAMLLLPGFIGLGALLLAATMFCTLLGHVFVFGDTPVETLVLLAATTAILWYRRREVLVLCRRHLGRRRLAGLVTADLYAAFFWLGVGICLAWSVMTAVVALEMFF
jgi:putative oxidoreductase